MKARKYDNAGKETGEVELPEAVFAGKISEGAMYEVLRAELMNRRQGTHKTKGLHEVRGGGRKPYRQKGTGNARQGTIRAPQYRGGAVIFGPKPRDYSLKMPVKKRRAAIRSMLSQKAEKVSVLEEVIMDGFSTKKWNDIFKNMGMGERKARIAYIAASEDEKLKKSIRNIANVHFMHAGRMTAPELFYADQLVISENALAVLQERYSKEEKRTGVSDK